MPKRLALALALGPFFYARSRPVVAALLFLAVLLLTAATQTGGAVLWLGLPGLAFAWRTIAGSWGYRLIATACLYALAHIAVGVIAVPPLAAAFGRAPLACGGQGSYGPLTVWTCLLNRHYATPEARKTLAGVSDALASAHPGVRVSYLDAGFPFFDWFPMLPHLSHRDGRKIDLALLNADPATGEPAAGRAPSPIGYWGYVSPKPGEPAPCAGRPSRLRWNFGWLQPLLADLTLDRASTGALLTGLAESPAVRRILLEPHLKARLAPGEPKIGFQGCAAARHDDHIHVEFR